MSNTEQLDTRLQRLGVWTRDTLKRDDLDISVASADASFRRYFRARSGAESWVVMDAPPEKEDTAPYIKVAQMLVASGVNAPKVFAQNSEEGFLLLSDLGNRTYLAELTDTSRGDELYAAAIEALVLMQVGCAPRVRELPPYDAALLNREMGLFPEWFLEKHLRLDIDGSERSVMDGAFAVLRDAALEQPRVFVHRDYHSRNLMVPERAAQGIIPGVLDFQDAVHGPTTYDLVSLLRDCYIAWPIDRVHRWLQDYRRRASQSGLDVGSSDGEFIRWFDLMGVQRHLKAIGIFSRLAHRDGKFGYLNDIPRTLGYVRAVLSSYAELQSFAQLVEVKVAPALAVR